MSDAAPPETHPRLSKQRIETLSDGVFAVVMTLLVLDVKPAIEPHAGDLAVVQMLPELRLPLLTFAFAFLVSSHFWILHQRGFALLRHTNRVHTTLSLLVLFTLTLLPVSVSIYMRANESHLAQTIYFGNFTLIALPLLMSALYARRAGLLDATQPAHLAQRLISRMLGVTLLGVIATLAFYLARVWVLFLAVPVLVYLRYRERSIRRAS